MREFDLYSSYSSPNTSNRTPFKAIHFNGEPHDDHGLYLGYKLVGYVPVIVD